VTQPLKRQLRNNHLGKNVSTKKQDPCYREEKDFLGVKQIPINAYYGIQTQRACDNFNLSGVPLSHYPNIINGLAMVKQACAKANFELGLLEKVHANAIIDATNLILKGQYHDAFVVDMIQGGAGTSTNMNANEVIANIGLELLGHKKGEYKYLHPNNHVNKSQSTNDVYPTALRLSVLLNHKKFVTEIERLRDSFLSKSVEFERVVKIGRTQLQDAVPMTLGQEFHAFATTIGEDIKHVLTLLELFKEINLGGTAIGSRINATPAYACLAIQFLSEISHFDLKQSSDLFEASSDVGVFVIFSGMLKRLAIKVSKISNDLRLLSMGPRCGLNEINLPPQQPGSSIMPGKINPVIPEAMSQVSYQVIGNDLAVTMAAEAGQLQLNAMEPLIAYNILQSMDLLTKGMHMLSTRCVSGITANIEHCKNLVNNSIGIITAITPSIGYENASRIASEAFHTGQSIIELVIKENLLDKSSLKELLKPENMV